ncbi:MAG: APC family permease, partial [Clostridia bacterium]|nr:APC family permease [Clostridia bacterium]
MNEKKLGLGSSIAVCVGLIVGTSCLVSLGSGIGQAGRWFLIPMFFVMVLNSFAGLSFSELHDLMPNGNGGTSQYLLAGAGPFVSLIGNMSSFVITMIISTCAEMSMCGLVLHDIFLPMVDYRIISIGLIAILFVVNCFGIDVFAKIQDVIVFLLIASMVVLGVLGVLKVGTGTPVPYSDPGLAGLGGFGGLMQYAAVAFWLFVGVEFVIPVAKDMKNPNRDVLLSMLLGLVMLYVVKAILGWGMTNYVTLPDLNSADLPHMNFSTNLLGQAGRYWMGIITFLASVSTMNTIYTSSSRIIQGMAEDGMLPKVLGKTNRHDACVPGLLIMGGGIGILIAFNLALTNSITFMILAASCFWILTYCLVHLSVLSLRRRYPDAPRKKALTLWGIPQILGIVGNAYMFWHIDTGAARLKIFAIFGILMALLSLYALLW